MNIQPVAATGTTGTSGSSNSNGTSSATDYETMFMKLLSTELQSQDPTQTVDPTTMVTQMVEINQLSDVAGIYGLLQSLTSSGGTTTGGAQAGVHTAAAAASTQTTAVGAHGTAQQPVSSSTHTTGAPGQHIQGGN
jgi:flagellar basal-body rod modification protein FlgD